eukprot:TRINITY_DN4171_c0_g1_i1.p1 TRINITY_DN4171_c0_g1~~TRINITY_DN4171_c0_g1_i1.p1  ORF type:complete len:279 (-),score=49.90 TRINITY_DN4171_c0_g1_i1:120-956(-)
MKVWIGAISRRVGGIGEFRSTLNNAFPLKHTSTTRQYCQSIHTYTNAKLGVGLYGEVLGSHNNYNNTLFSNSYENMIMDGVSSNGDGVYDWRNWECLSSLPRKTTDSDTLAILSKTTEVSTDLYEFRPKIIFTPYLETNTFKDSQIHHITTHNTTTPTTISLLPNFMIQFNPILYQGETQEVTLHPSVQQLQQCIQDQLVVDTDVVCRSEKQDQGYSLISVVRRRKLKINKHLLKKRRRKMKAILKRYGKVRNVQMARSRKKLVTKDVENKHEKDKKE